MCKLILSNHTTSILEETPCNAALTAQTDMWPYVRVTSSTQPEQLHEGRTTCLFGDAFSCSSDDSVFCVYMCECVCTMAVDVSCGCFSSGGRLFVAWGKALSLSWSVDCGPSLHKDNEEFNCYLIWAQKIAITLHVLKSLCWLQIRLKIILFIFLAFFLGSYPAHLHFCYILTYLPSLPRLLISWLPVYQKLGGWQGQNCCF